MEEGAHSTATTVTGIDHLKLTTANLGEPEKKMFTAKNIPLSELRSPTVTGVDHFSPLPFQRRRTVDLDDYFTGPRDMSRHSKWPLFLQMHGSILPKMVLPLFLIACWSTAITVINQLVYKIGIGMLSPTNSECS